MKNKNEEAIFYNKSIEKIGKINTSIACIALVIYIFLLYTIASNSTNMTLALLIMFMGALGHASLVISIVAWCYALVGLIQNRNNLSIKKVIWCIIEVILAIIAILCLLIYFSKLIVFLFALPLFFIIFCLNNKKQLTIKEFIFAACAYCCPSIIFLLVILVTTVSSKI